MLRGNLARTNGGYRLLIYGVLPLGSAAGGIVGQAAGSRTGVAVGAVGIAASAVPMYARRIRRLASPKEAGIASPREATTREARPPADRVSPI